MTHTPKDGTNRRRDALLLTSAILMVLAGCADRTVPYGVESQVSVSATRGTTWAVAPVMNLSGQPTIDPLLQADLVFQQLQQIQGITAIPVDRVVGVFASLGIDQVQNAEQAAVVCELLGADALLVPAVTAWDPYAPPKMGATLTLFTRPGAFAMDNTVDPAELVRRATPAPGSPQPVFAEGVVQAVGMFDAADGSVREAVFKHAAGRSDPIGPWGPREYFVNSEKYASFVYRQLTRRLLDQVYMRSAPPAELASARSTPTAAGAPAATASGSGAAPAGTAPPPPKNTFPPGGPAGPQPFPSNRR